MVSTRQVHRPGTVLVGCSVLRNGLGGERLPIDDEVYVDVSIGGDICATAYGYLLYRPVLADAEAVIDGRVVLIDDRVLAYCDDLRIVVKVGASRKRRGALCLTSLKVHRPCSARTEENHQRDERHDTAKKPGSGGSGRRRNRPTVPIGIAR